jgi:hypothetical protein
MLNKPKMLRGLAKRHCSWRRSCSLSYRGHHSYRRKGTTYPIQVVKLNVVSP